MNKIKINFLGSNYTVSTPEDEEYVLDIVDDLSAQVSQLMNGSRMSQFDAMVLCLLEYADRYRKSEKSADNLRNQLVGYLGDVSRANKEADDSAREIEKLNKEIEVLRNLVGKKPLDHN